MTFGNKVIIAMDLTDYVKPGLEAGEIQLGAGMTIHKDEVCGLSMICRSAPIKRVVRVKPAIVSEYSNLGTAEKLSGVALCVERDVSPETVETYLSIDTRRDYTFDFSKNATPTIAQITAELVAKINAIDPQDNWSVQRPFTATVDPNNSEWMIIEGNRAGLFDVYATWNGKLGGHEVIQPGSEGSLGDKEVRRMFPAVIGHVTGMDVAEEWMGCKSPCVVYVSVFIDGKKTNQYNNMQNAVPNYVASTAATYEFWINRADPQYAAFLSALQTATEKTIEIKTPTNLDLRAGRDITVTVAREDDEATFTVAAAGSQINDSEINFGTKATLIPPTMTSKVLSEGSDGIYVDSAATTGASVLTVTYTINKSGIVTTGSISLPVTVPA